MLFLLKYRGSPLSTIFGTWKKSDYAKFILVEYSIPRLNLTSPNLLIRNSNSTNLIAYSTKICTSGICISGDRTSGGPLVHFLGIKM
jgi:hypothetical protein